METYFNSNRHSIEPLVSQRSHTPCRECVPQAQYPPITATDLGEVHLSFVPACMCWEVKGGAEDWNLVLRTNTS
ncbi:hypothetical protein KOW79_008906 [Hemibagrus wyckioides]|uniref:Uncharacterized protein n=1 Tax=Hemibagrus wyckioides TaxID=337641 RepID=A0A9D3NUE1_9TELE|nr:hypothetical protein KOW79_008906 [Hemibagrus wyckioides]